MAKRMSLEAAYFLCFAALFFAFVGLVMAADTEIPQQCQEDFQKVTQCLNFATGKAEAPSKECCGSVSDIKKKDPVCLCYVIQQIHKGNNPGLKSMGIQEARLLQLPSACKLANASISDCPKLLHIAPGTSEYAIFTNTSSLATPSSSSGTSSSSTAPSGSNGYKLGPKLAGSQAVLAVAMAIFYSVI